MNAFYRAIQNDSKFCYEFAERVLEQKELISNEYLLRVILLKICNQLKKGEPVTK